MATAEAQTIHLLNPIVSGVPGPEHFEVRTSTASKCSKPGQIRVKAKVFSADPYLRGGCKTKPAGEAMAGFIAGIVVESTAPAFKENDLVGASAEFSTDQVIDVASTVVWNLTSHITIDQISLGVGVLGMPGSTAYGGFIDVLRPNPGETVWVSAAAGAVGGLVGQIAKIKGCTAIGSCGGEVKCAMIKEKLGFDHSIDYKTCNDAKELEAKIREIAPDGIVGPRAAAYTRVHLSELRPWAGHVL